jgi:hypothetical protein
MSEPCGVKTALFTLVLWTFFFTPGHAEARIGVGPSWPAYAASRGIVLSQRWEELSPRQRQRALKNFQRFQQLSPKRQRSLEQRYQHWRSLPPEEQQLDPYEKEEFEEHYREWQSRPRRK